jgi:hypothetical protein
MHRWFYLFTLLHHVSARWVTAVALALILLPFILIIPDAAAQSSEVVISPDNLNGWTLRQEPGPGPATGEFVFGPNPAPLGLGSLRLRVTNSSVGEAITRPLPNTPLGDVTSLTYHTYRASGSSAQTISLQFQVCRSFAFGFCLPSRLVYEPYYNGVPATGSWQQWNALASGARWWLTRVGTGACNINSPCTLPQLFSAYPQIQIRNENNVGVALKAGSGWPNFDGYVDNLTIGINGVETTYNFEPFLPVHNLTQDTRHLTIQAGVNDANAGDVLLIAPGTFVENVVVDKALTLRGSGDGADPTTATILDGSTLSGMGIRLNNHITDVTIEEMRIVNYGGVNPSAGIYGNGNNHNLTIQNVTVNGNGPGFVSASGGIVLNGPINQVLIDNVTAHNNWGRGIVIWNGAKTNITITNNDVGGNNCCGIELQDGTASGVTMTGNVVANNADSGMSVMGLTAGAGPNLIANNVVTNNGRFGIEIKNPNGNGQDSGDGSIVVADNQVSFTPSVGMDRRDHAGIAVFRRDVQAVNVSIPTGVFVRHNDVSGYRQENPASSESEGFGIVIEGTNHTIMNNTLTDNDIAIHEQGGAHPNANHPGNGVQNDGQSPDYFGRGNAELACGNLIVDNLFVEDGSGSGILSNGESFRRIVAPELGLITNLNTSRTFCYIQAAINHSGTVDGHTLLIAPGMYTEAVDVHKTVTLQGPNAGVFGGGARTEEVVINGEGDTAVTITAPNVTLDGFQLIGQNGLRIEAANAQAQNNLMAVAGVGVSVTADHHLLLRGNQITAVTLFDLSETAGLTAYANHFQANGTVGLTAVTPQQNVRHNWWGSHDTPPTGVEGDSWAYRLGAPIVGWADGVAAVALPDAIANADATFSGAGTLVIINHGSGLERAPFGKGISNDTGANQCADFYDFFAIGGSGEYSISIPVDAACDAQTIGNKLFQFALDGSGAPDLTCAPDTACWNAVNATHAGDVLTAVVSADNVLGTPFAAPSRNDNDPTAVTLSSFAVATDSPTLMSWLVGMMAAVGITAVVRHKKMLLMNQLID